MTLRAITDQLRERIGLDPDSLGPTAILNAIASRTRALGLPAGSSYAKHLANSPAEFTALVDEIVVSESWFFRGGKLFAHLADHLRRAAEGSHVGRAFRILSVPCATGEEPYSLAIALTELEVPASAWQIDAVDLSDRHLNLAVEARYTDFSFRQIEPDLRDRYFQAVERGWELSSSIRSMVRFRQGNLVDPTFLSGEAAYDLILCRNLLIYLHPIARQQVIATLDRLLGPEGIIAMGHAESLSSMDPRFCSVAADGFFTFRRTAHQGQLVATGEPIRRSKKSSSGKTAVDKPSPSSRGRLTVAPISKPVPLQAKAIETLARARAQANSGQLSAALDSCTSVLATNGPSADVYALMGEIHQAHRNTDEAIACFQRSLYLQPNHADSLFHLLLLYQQVGADSQVAVLQSRIERVAADRGNA